MRPREVACRGLVARSDKEPTVVRFLWVGFAGALGTWVRYGINLWAAQRFGPAFPVGTLIVNVVGCFLIGAVMHVSLNSTNFPVTLRLALTAGFMGGLTTYSSFNYETLKLFQEGAVGSALLNFGGTTVLCAGAGLLGLFVGARLVGS